MKDNLKAIELLDYITQIIPKDNNVDLNDLRERIESCTHYSLKTISLSDLDPDEWAISEYKLDRYLTLDPAKMPPIIVHLYKNGSYSIVDGTHRVNTLLKLNKKTILAYVGLKKY